ncbi:hypothetical protein AVEN_136848-1 [Araneus ventricosus]|uniref:Uncharacterized protein n=1 Tax=Araneus ventricosus TaxID=182803 RepID=A0A4Y2G3I6_ARAVE|nr:hypothetical protein AVEN_136848-1 [Araneus ventricosus]
MFSLSPAVSEDKSNHPALRRRPGHLKNDRCYSSDTEVRVLMAITPPEGGMYRHRERGDPRLSKNFPLTATKAGLRRLGSLEGRGGSEISAVGGPIILANRSPFPSALREGYSRGWGKSPPMLGESNSCRIVPKRSGFKEARRKKSPRN